MSKHTVSCERPFALELLEERQLLSTTLPWGTYPLLVGQDQAFANYPYLSGAGQTVAIIDQGVDYDHVSLGGGLGAGFKVEAGVNFGDGNPADPMDTQGHGTAVAGIIAANAYSYLGSYYQGIAEDANIVALRQTNSNEVKSALDWVIANYKTYNISVINLTDFVGSGFSPNVYASELQTLNQDGIFIVSPVGNGGATGTIELPAGSPYVYGAGAVDDTDTVWQINSSTGTQLGSELNFLAPGVDVTTTAYDVANQHATYVNIATGTSFASPHIAGTALLLKQLEPALTPAQIAGIIEQSGTPVVAQDGNTYPRLNVNAAITLAFSELDGGNNSEGTAKSLDLNSGSASANNQYLLIQHDDWYSFTLASPQTVNVSIAYGGPSGQPTEQLISSLGVTTNINGNLTEQLGPGTYYIHMTSPQSLNGTFNLHVSDGTSATPTPFPGAATINSMAYNSSGTLFVAYYSPSSNDLMFTSNTGGVWTTPQTIDASPATGLSLSLAVDSGGLPGVAYYDANNGQLKYAHFNGSTWSTQVVDSTRHTGDYPSLAFVGLTPTISYSSGKVHSLRLATLIGSSWSIQTVDNNGDTGLSSSLVMNPSIGHWSIAYLDNTGGAFKFAQFSKKGLSITTVDSGIGGGFISLAYNSSDEPAFSYYDGTNQVLKFAQLNGKRWSTTIVDQHRHQTIGENTNLSFSGNEAEILYFNFSARAVFAAIGSIGNWSITQEETNAGANLTQAVDPNSGLVTIAFTDNSLGNLRVDDLS